MTVDLIDHGEKLVRPLPLSPMDFVNAYRPHLLQLPLRQTPLHKPFHRAVHRFPTGLKHLGRLSPAQPPRPAGQEPPSSPALPDACLHSTESVPPPLHAPRIPRAAARTENGWGFPTAAQIASTAPPVGRSPGPASDTASTDRACCDAPPAGSRSRAPPPGYSAVEPLGKQTP